MQPYEMLWRTDENGTPCSVAIEEQVVVGENLYLTLEEIPDSYQRVTITTDNGRIYETMNRSQLTKNRFHVDYNSGIVYFDSSLLGKKLTINYYGRGYKRIHSSRIVMNDGSNLAEALGRTQVQVTRASTQEDADTISLQEQIDTVCKFVRKQQRVIEMLAEELESMKQKLEERGV